MGTTGDQKLPNADGEGGTEPSNFEGSSVCTAYAEVSCASVSHFRR